MSWLVRVRGEGRVSAAAYGLADAEHLVEKEVSRLLPGAVVEILEVTRPPGGARIVEELAVSYRLHAELRVEAADADAARRVAFREARARLEGSRYRTTSWSAPIPPAETT